jgi:hypothetical protein
MKARTRSSAAARCREPGMRAMATTACGALTLCASSTHALANGAAVVLQPAFPHVALEEEQDVCERTRGREAPGRAARAPQGTLAKASSARRWPTSAAQHKSADSKLPVQASDRPCQPPVSMQLCARTRAVQPIAWLRAKKARPPHTYL